ncbi:unnamed protein product, partial [Prorocentrum cordatum]
LLLAPPCAAPRVDGYTWIALVLDRDLVRVKVLDVRHELLERRAPFPGHLANQVDAAETMIRVVAEPRSPKFGEVAEAGIMEDDARGTSFDTKGAAVVDGEDLFVQEIAASALTDFKTTMKTDMGDVRTLGEHIDEAGQGNPRFSEAVALMRDMEQASALSFGVRSAKEPLDSAASGPGNMVSYQAERERLSGVGEGSAVNHVRRNLCEVIWPMHSWDQVDHSMLSSAEFIARWMAQTETAVERNPRHPDYSGLGVATSAPVNAAGRAPTSKFNAEVTDGLKERAAI